MNQLEDKSSTQSNCRKSTFLEKRVLPVLNYEGAIGAVIMCIAYLVVVVLLIEGAHVQQGFDPSTIVYVLVNAVVGLMITQFLKVQGISFAKSLPENKEIIDKYYKNKTKDKKYRNIKFYWITSLLKDIVSKGLTITLTSCGLVYVCFKGTGNYMLLLLAIFNILMFICFGFVSLVNAYEFYNNKHVPYMIHELEVSEKTNKSKKNKTEDLKCSK